MPGIISKDIKEILNSIENEKYDYFKLEKFRQKYVIDIENCTREILKLIIEK